MKDYQGRGQGASKGGIDGARNVRGKNKSVMAKRIKIMLLLFGDE